MSSLDEDLTVAKLKIAAIDYVLSKGTIGSIENNYIVLYNGTSKEQLWKVMSDLQTEKNNLQTEKNNLLKKEIALIEKESLEIREKTQQSGMSSSL
jgi:hypothetical protein